MYFKIFIENVSNRMFSLAQKEGVYKGTILYSINYMNDTSIIHCICENVHELSRIILALEADNVAFTSLVEDLYGEYVPFRDKFFEKTSDCNRCALSFTH